MLSNLHEYVITRHVVLLPHTLCQLNHGNHGCMPYHVKHYTDIHIHTHACTCARTHTQHTHTHTYNILVTVDNSAHMMHNYRCETADDIKSITTKEQVEKLANQIEEDLFSLHNEITLKYKNKYRSLLFNLRDSKNQVSLVDDGTVLIVLLFKGLFQKVVRGRLETKELVTLSSEQLASEELTQWRQQEIKKV